MSLGMPKGYFNVLLNIMIGLTVLCFLCGRCSRSGRGDGCLDALSRYKRFGYLHVVLERNRIASLDACAHVMCSCKFKAMNLRGPSQRNIYPTAPCRSVITRVQCWSPTTLTYGICACICSALLVGRSVLILMVRLPLLHHLCRRKNKHPITAHSVLESLAVKNGYVTPP